MIRITHDFKIKPGDILVCTTFSSYVSLAGVVIKQTDDSWAWAVLPEFNCFPYSRHLRTSNELLEALKGKFKYVDKADYDLPIHIQTLQDVSFEEKAIERQKIIENIFKDLSKEIAEKNMR